MRTTIDIENDVLMAAKELARLQNVSAGCIVSRLMREALAGYHAPLSSSPRQTSGFRPFPERGALVTNDQVNRLRDEEGV